MPRYHFHYQRGRDQLVEDVLGSEHDDLEQAEMEARSVAFDILRDELDKGEVVSVARCLQVEDEHGEVVLYLPFWASPSTLGPPEGVRGKPNILNERFVRLHS